MHPSNTPMCIPSYPSATHVATEVMMSLVFSWCHAPIKDALSIPSCPSANKVARPIPMPPMYVYTTWQLLHIHPPRMQSTHKCSHMMDWHVPRGTVSLGDKTNNVVSDLQSTTACQCRPGWWESAVQDVVGKVPEVCKNEVVKQGWHMFVGKLQY